MYINRTHLVIDTFNGDTVTCLDCKQTIINPPREFQHHENHRISMTKGPTR